MEEAVELADYLPNSFQSPKEQEYISFLWEAFETNYRYGKYQFAFLAYHMLTMSFIYFEIWQIKKNRRSAFEMAMVGFNKDLERELLDSTSPFTFWRVPESTVLRFLKLIGCDISRVGNYAALVRERNDSAHSNGNIFFSTKEALDVKITEVLRIVAEIQAHSNTVIEHCYRDFLLQNLDSEDWQYSDPIDQVREVLIHANYLSQKDLETCLGFDLLTLVGEAESTEMFELHQALHSVNALRL